MTDIFTAKKGPTEIIDFVINYDDLFDDFNPTDQISSSSWEVMRGEVVVDSDRVEGTSDAVARISGGTKYNSLHEIRNTVVCVSGQRYVRSIEIKVAKT